MSQNTPQQPNIDQQTSVEPQAPEMPLMPGANATPPPMDATTGTDTTFPSSDQPPSFQESQEVPPIPVKKSPFRFLFPILLLLLVVGLVFMALRWWQGRQESSSNNQETGSAISQDTVNLTYWGLWEPSPVMQAVFDEFRQTHPNVTINYQQQSAKDYRERLTNAIIQGNGPDVFRFHNTWVPMMTQVLDTMPDGVMNPQTYASTFYPVAQQTLQTQRGIVGIPLMYEGLGLYYNKTIFDTAGKTPPTSWEELRDLATELTIRDGQGNIQQAGVALGTTSNVDHWSDILGLMFLQNNADPAMPNDQLGQDALEFYTLFSESDLVWDDTLPASTYAFAIEKVAMMFAPSWRAQEVYDINPSLQFAIAPVPQLPGSEVTWASFWSEGVSSESGSKEQQAAWELLNFMAEKETLRTFYTAASDIRLFGEPFSRVDLADQLIGDPYVGAYISQAPKAQSWYLSSRTFDNGLNDRISKYYLDAINSVNQGRPPSEALETAQQGIQQVLQQYNLAR